MEKKEPILAPAKISSQEVENKKVVNETSEKVSSKKSFKETTKEKLAKAKAKIKELKERLKQTKLSDKQKRFSIAFLVCLIVILLTVWVISLFNTDKANVASLEQAKPAPVAEKKVEPKKAKTEDKKESFFSRLFSKKEEKVEVIAPSFDIVRMEKGEAVIAGQAGKGDVVHILDNGREIGKEKADDNGQWVFIPKTALAEGNRKLSLFVIDKDGNKVKSKQSAVLRVSKKSNDEVAVVVGGKKQSKVLKAPKGQEIGVLRVAKIDYNDEGSFKVEGLAKKNSTVNLYMNNKFVGKAVANASGIWTVDANLALSNKKQVIRADMLSSKGKVAKRVEYTFTPVLFDGENAMTVIKKGDCLWNIAVREYGRGTDYVIIFEANKKQIKDPNKIYVGQVFSVIKKDSETFKSMKKSKK
ncbi:MAG: LysM peptidoglycan-binding domain-containing protein [Alphaproteobacteria bacterium]|nr:LysM peptidoglycan-binding domain-containing protein [Alphaproteobacteria bacterium]